MIFSKTKIEHRTLDRNKIAEFIFLISFVLLLFVDYVSATSISIPFSGRIFQLVVVLLGIKILMTKYSKPQWILLMCGAILSVLSFYYTNSYYVCILIMLIMASKDIELKKIMYVYICLVSFITVFVGILAIIGIQGQVYLERDFRGTGVEIRYCMGYTHPNTYHIILIQLMIVWIWILWDKLKWYSFLPLFALNIVVTCFTDSRTNLIIGSLVLVAYSLAKIFPGLMNWAGSYVTGALAFIGSIVLSVLAALVGDTIPIMYKLNHIWSNRIRTAYYLRLQADLELLGDNRVPLNVDMGFVNMAYCYGLLIVFLIVGIILYQIVRMIRQRNFVVLIGFVAGLVFFLGERFSSSDFVTRDLMFIYMLGWGVYGTKKQST